MIMNRRQFSKSVAAAAAGTLLATRSVAAQTSAQVRNIVFAHGLFADGSCWSDVIAIRQPLGFRCTSVQNPLTSFPDAVESVARVLDRQEGATVLVATPSPECW